MTRHRRVLLAGLLLLLVLAVVELCCFAFFRLAGRRFAYANPEQYTLDEEQLRVVRRRFDAELGWQPRFDTRFGERPRQAEFGRPLLMAFGDSHTFCDEVKDTETWEEALAATLRGDVYNFGVGGYGPDQALLRFRQKRATVPAPVAALGFGFENINRVVNRYRAFYAPDTGLPLPKPRFVLRDGTLVLLPNPLRRTEDLERLRDPAFIHRLGQDDDWYSRSGLPRRGFPYTRLLFSRAIWTQALEQRAGRNDNDARPLRNLWKDEPAQALFLAVLDAFVAEARSGGLRPLLLVQPGREQLKAVQEGRRMPGYEQVMEHCAAQHYECFDGVVALTRDRDPAAFGELIAPHGHLSAAGNQVFGLALAEYLKGTGDGMGVGR